MNAGKELVRLFLDEQLGDGDAALTGHTVEQIDPPVFFEDRRVAQIQISAETPSRQMKRPE